jgi:hypothetical protein
VYAHNEEEVRRSFRPSATPVPIFVEYRGIPGSTISREAIPWAPAFNVRVSITALTVTNDGSYDLPLLSKADWSPKVTCTINGSATHEAGMPSPLFAPQRVEGGVSIPTYWSHTFEGLSRRDTLSCVVGGRYTTNVAVYEIPEAGTGVISPERAGVFLGRHEGRNAKAAYVIDYRVDVSELP